MYDCIENRKVVGILANAPLTQTIETNSTNKTNKDEESEKPKSERNVDLKKGENQVENLKFETQLTNQENNDQKVNAEGDNWLEDCIFQGLWNDEKERAENPVDFQTLDEKPEVMSENSISSKMTDWSILTTHPSYPQFKKEFGLQVLYSEPPERVLRKQYQRLPKKSLPCEWDYTNAVIKPEEFTDNFPEVECSFNFSGNFQDNCDIGTTYLGHDNMNSATKMKAEYNIPVDNNSYTMGQLVDGTAVRILIDSGASQSFMSHAYYMNNPQLHHLPKLQTENKSIKVGNGEPVAILFMIPVLVNIKGHRFEIFTMVSRIHDGVDLVIGVKNMRELEAELSPRHSCMKFLCRSAPIFPTTTYKILPKEKVLMTVEIPFSENISAHAIFKLTDFETMCTLKVKVQNNRAIIKAVNMTNTTQYFDPSKPIGILDLRSIGYFRVTHYQFETDLKHMEFQKLSLIMDQLNDCITQTREQRQEKKPPDPATINPSMAQFLNMNQIKKIQKKKGNKGEKNTKIDPKTDPYPWLEANDERREMSDEQILDKYIDLSKSCMNRKEKKDFMKMLKENKQAFSLRDEIGECPNIKIDIDVIDKSPFFVRPFPINENDKEKMDWQMNRLVSLGILSKNSTSHTSPVMLITRKVTADKRAVTDFRLLNTRIRRRNTSTTLMSDIYSILGRSGCEVLSCVDLKDAYHSLKLTDEAKEYCGILPYFGGTHYRYEVLPMGLSISPCKWMEYVNFLLSNMPSKENFIAIMDDLLIHSKAVTHKDKIKELLDAIIKHGLKLSPKKCQFFRKELTYMGNVFTITEDGITIKPLKSRIKAMQDIPTPTTTSKAKSFCGVVNYMALFCKDLQKLLSPIYELTRKDRPFQWGEAQQKAFVEIKHRLTRAPILALPQRTGRFTMYSDTSKTHCGSSLWQNQNGKDRLIGYGSKTLPKACANYSVTELEMSGLLYNMWLWRNWLKGVDFDAAVDHSAIPHIMKSKNAPATARIAKLLTELQRWSFNLYYVKGKDMILSDYLSRCQVPDDDPRVIIPISYSKLMVDKLFKDNTSSDEHVQQQQLLVLTRGRAATEGIKVPEVQGKDKALDPHVKPEHDKKKQMPQKQIQPFVAKKSATQQTTRKLIQRSIKHLTHKPTNTKHVRPRAIKPNSHPINSGQDERTDADMFPPQEFPTPSPANDETTNFVPHTPNFVRETTNFVGNTPNFVAHSGKTRLHNRPTQISAKWPKAITTHSEGGNDTGGPVDEWDVETNYRTPVRGDFVIPPSLGELVNENQLIHKHLPKQADIDKILAKIKHKILRQTNLHTELKDMEAAYLNSPHFRDIYIFLTQNRTPTNKRAARRVEQEWGHYMILDKLLFKIKFIDTTEPIPVLCIPTSKVDMLLEHYHSSVMGCHAGITKCYLTISSRFYCPNLAHHIRAYVTGCHICQQFKKGKKFQRPFNKRININTPALSKLSMDIKHMPTGTGGYKFILVLLCEVTNFMIAYPMRSTTAEEVGKNLIKLITRHAKPSQIISDQDPAFTGRILSFLSKCMGSTQTWVSPTNHKSLLAEHGIKSLGNILTKHLTDAGKNWTEYLDWAVMVHNVQESTNLDGHSPFQLVYGYKPTLIPDLEIIPEDPLTGTYRDFVERLRKKIRYLRKQLYQFRDKRTEMQNKDREIHRYQVGDLVYLYQPKGSILQSGTRKFTCHFVGPLVIHQAVSPNLFFLMSVDGMVYPHLIEETRIKPGCIRTHLGNVTTLASLRHILRTGMGINELKPKTV